MTKQEVLTDFLKDIECDIDLVYYLDNNETYEDFENNLYESNAFDVEFTYYSEAMKYLMENDSSLNESTGLAQDMGFEAKGLNSCVLAQLLATEKLKEEYIKYHKEDIEDFFDNLDVTMRNLKIEEILEYEG